MRTSALFGAKTSDILKFMVCLHGQGWEWVNPTRSNGVIFRDFVRTSFMDSIL